MAHFLLKLAINSYFEDRKASPQQAASCRLRGKPLRPKKVGQSLPRNGGRGRRSCSSHWRKTQLEIPTSLTPGCIRLGAENGLQWFLKGQLLNLWGVKTLNPNAGMECSFWTPSPVSQPAPGSVPVAQDLQLRIELSGVGVEELLSESALVPGTVDRTLQTESLRESP